VLGVVTCDLPEIGRSSYPLLEIAVTTHNPIVVTSKISLDRKTSLFTAANVAIRSSSGRSAW
jgi:hypothetical protein